MQATSLSIDAYLQACRNNGRVVEVTVVALICLFRLDLPLRRRLHEAFGPYVNLMTGTYVRGFGLRGDHMVTPGTGLRHLCKQRCRTFCGGS